MFAWGDAKVTHDGILNVIGPSGDLHALAERILARLESLLFLHRRHHQKFFPMDLHYVSK